MKYIDIHTHNNKSNADIALVNLSPEDTLYFREKGYFSTGVHPWYINEDTIDNELQIVEDAASKDEFVAVGEAGIDKFARSPVELQKSVFKKQVEISEKYSKPLIIHCVRMFNDLVRIRKEVTPKSVWIVHGFNANVQIARELIKNGFYLSFGKALLNKNSNAFKILPEIQTDRVFLETDDSNLDIETIYKNATFAMNIKEEKLGKIIENNFNKIFGTH